MTRNEKISVAISTFAVAAAYVVVLGVLFYPALQAGRWIA